MERLPRAKTNSLCREAFPQIIAVIGRNLILFAFGLLIGFPTILLKQIMEGNEKNDFDIFKLIWIVNLIFIPLGCLISGPLSQKFGRKTVIQFANVPILAIWLIYLFSKGRWEICIVAMCLSGLVLGSAQSPLICYISEISSPHLRGSLLATTQISITIGVVSILIAGDYFIWQDLCLICLLFPIIAFNYFFLLPESHFWLISQDKFLSGRASLAWYRGWVHVQNIDIEFKKIYKEIISCRPNKYNPHQEDKVCNKKLWLWFILLLFAFTLTHLILPAGVIFTILSSKAVEVHNLINLGLLEISGGIVCTVLVPYTGKRVLIFISTTLTIVCLISLILNLHLENFYLYTEWLPHAFIFFSHCGIKTIPWILAGEIFTNNTRARGVGVLLSFNYLFGLSFERFLCEIFENPYLTIILIITGLIFLGCFQPATEGKALQEIPKLLENTNYGLKYTQNERNIVDSFSFNLNRLESGDENTYKNFEQIDLFV